MDPCHHTDDECLVRVGEKASQSYEELFRVMSNILIRCRPQASIKSGESQYSGNSGMFLYLFCCCCCCCLFVLFCFALFFFLLSLSYHITMKNAEAKQTYNYNLQLS